MPGDYVNATMQTVMGPLEAKFTSALNRVFKDISDPAKAAEAKREIVVTIRFTPDAERLSVMIEGDALPKLARSKPSKSFMLMSQSNDGPVGRVSNARQLTLNEQLEQKTHEQEA